MKLKVPGEVVYLEDVVGSRTTTDDPLTPALSPTDGERVAEGRVRVGPLSFGEKLTAFLLAWLLPVGWLERALGNCRRRRKKSLTSPLGKNNQTPHVVSYEAEDPLDDLATVIFSSGSTGEPKGVMLSHYNIGSNIEQMGQVFAFQRNDRVLGVLPFFHSLGFTGTLMLPSVLGLGAAYHANPLDAKTIGPLVCDHNVTFLLATPTFLQLYLRGCTAEQFGSVRLVAVGAEKLPDRVAAAFDEQFGIRPFEAYGCTECAPAVTVNTHDFRAAGFRQVGHQTREDWSSVAGRLRAHCGSGDARAGADGSTGFAACARPEHHARLPRQARENRGSFARRLVHDRRRGHAR
ncbi:MAG: AMP-binding protein [Verrucomicrobiota bacterium]